MYFHTCRPNCGQVCYFAYRLAWRDLFYFAYTVTCRLVYSDFLLLHIDLPTAGAFTLHIDQGQMFLLCIYIYVLFMDLPFGKCLYFPCMYFHTCRHCAFHSCTFISM